MISIIILTKNPGNRIKKVLEEVFDQKIDEDYELIIIDSGTTDGYLDFLEKSSARLIKINPSDFGHSRTRNYAVTLSKGEFVVMLVQDAIPANENWLRELISPMIEDKNVAGVCSRQIPYDDASVMEKFFINYKYPDFYIERTYKKSLTVEDVFFSNVSSAMRRDVLLEIKFDENIVMSEDQQWARDVLKKGYKIVYNNKSVVYHSHRYTLKSVFQRFFDSGVSLKQLNLTNQGNIRNGLKYIFQGFNYYNKELGMLKFLLHAPYIVLYEMMRFTGFFLGCHYKLLPLNFVSRFSMFSDAVINRK